jgi:hypothetical protein
MMTFCVKHRVASIVLEHDNTVAEHAVQLPASGLLEVERGKEMIEVPPFGVWRNESRQDFPGFICNE